MAFTPDNEPITAGELREFCKYLVELHDDELDEPYDGAGFCTCITCQEICPRIFAAARRIEQLEAKLMWVTNVK